MKTVLPIFSACLLICACIFSSASPAFAQIDELCPRPDSIPTVDSTAATAAQVESGDATLAQFVASWLNYALPFSASPLAAGYIGCILTREGPWNSGSTYITTMTTKGTLVLHGQDLLLSGGVVNAALLQEVFAAASSSEAGGAFTFNGEGGYALPYFNPDGSPAYLIAGLDIQESHLEEETIDPGAEPTITAREVVDRETLKTFVTSAAAYFLELYNTESFDGILKIKRILRDTTGYWRHGPTYLFIIDGAGYTFFHGAFPEKYELLTPTETLIDAVTGEKIIPKIIAAAASSEEGGFVEYHFDNPDDDSDSVEIPKVTFALQHELPFTLPNDVQATFTSILGAGIYETATTSAEPLGGEIPEAFALEQNYPNPFNPSTTIGFSLERAQAITLTVYDMLGREVRVLADGVQPAGRYSIPFDGAGLSGGAYLYVLRTAQDVSAKTMTLLK